MQGVGLAIGVYTASKFLTASPDVHITRKDQSAAAEQWVERHEAARHRLERMHGMDAISTGVPKTGTAPME